MSVVETSQRPLKTFGTYLILQQAVPFLEARRRWVVSDCICTLKRTLETLPWF